MGGYVADRGGWDGPNRIATTAEYTTLATELLPGEPMYAPIPFFPSIISGSGGALGSAGTDSWSNVPGRVDLTWYQGDDITIPLTIEDPADVTPDMSTQWDWVAQIRICHTFRSTLVNTFAVKDEYFPPDADTAGFTQVTLFLPRSENLYIGRYRWDLYSKAPLTLTGFPQPPDVIAPEPWPPTDQIRTWLFGEVTILPRVTSTDVLDTDPLPVVPVVPGATINLGILPFAGPNGRVP